MIEFNDKNSVNIDLIPIYGVFDGFPYREYIAMWEDVGVSYVLTSWFLILKNGKW